MPNNSMMRFALMLPRPVTGSHPGSFESSAARRAEPGALVVTLYDVVENAVVLVLVEQRIHESNGTTSGTLACDARDRAHLASLQRVRTHLLLGLAGDLVATRFSLLEDKFDEGHLA